jgi:hypothetical protein
MEFLKEITHYGGFPVWVLFFVPALIFTATPKMPFCYKEGRIIVAWLMGLIGIIYIYGVLPEYDPNWHRGSYRYYFLKHNFINLALFAMLNMYMGWWEFLWRCIYRQWTWPPMMNLQYGLFSNLCVLGSAAFMLCTAILLILVLTRII